MPELRENQLRWGTQSLIAGMNRGVEQAGAAAEPDALPLAAASQLHLIGLAVRGGAAGLGQHVGDGLGLVHLIQPRRADRAEHVDAPEESDLDRRDRGG